MLPQYSDGAKWLRIRWNSAPEKQRKSLTGDHEDDVDNRRERSRVVFLFGLKEPTGKFLPTWKLCVSRDGRWLNLRWSRIAKSNEVLTTLLNYVVDENSKTCPRSFFKGWNGTGLPSFALQFTRVCRVASGWLKKNNSCFDRNGGAETAMLVINSYCLFFSFAQQQQRSLWWIIIETYTDEPEHTHKG